MGPTPYIKKTTERKPTTAERAGGVVDEWTDGRAWWTRVLHRNTLNTLGENETRNKATRRGAASSPAEETLNIGFVRPSE